MKRGESCATRHRLSTQPLTSSGDIANQSGALGRCDAESRPFGFLNFDRRIAEIHPIFINIRKIARDRVG